MTMELSFSLCFIFILSAIHSGESIQCYSCSTKTDPTCVENDKLDSFKTECSSKTIDEGKRFLTTTLQYGTDITSKLGFNAGKTASNDANMVCQRVDFEANDQKYTVRSCSFERKDSESMCDLLKKPLHSDSVKISHCSQCTESFCNSSNEIVPALFTMLIVLATATLFN